MNTYAFRVPRGRELKWKELMESSETAMPAFDRIRIPMKWIYFYQTARERAETGQLFCLKTAPMFPGYMLAETEDPTLFQQILNSLWTSDGFLYKVPPSRDPCVVTPTELDRISRLGAKPGTLLRCEGKLKFEEERLQGMEDFIWKTDLRKRRLCLKMSFFGKEHEIWLGFRFAELTAEENG